MTTTLPETAEVLPLIADAVAAPSMHNAQPWKFVHHPESGIVELHGDPARAMAHADPDHRALHLGCAAALFNLRVSATWAGWEPTVRLLPDHGDPWFLAEVRLRRPERADLATAALHSAVRRRHSSRFPFSEEEIPPALLDGLRSAALLEGCRLAVPDAWHTETVLGLVHDSEHREEIDPTLRAETKAWTYAGTPEQQVRPDGIPSYAFGPKQSGRGAVVRDFGRSEPVPGRGWAAFERRPHLALLGTTGDTPEDWLRAGQALERVLLQATADGLVTSMTSQPLEWPELRWTVRDPGASMSHVQMVIRLGYGPEGPATPRRPVTDVLDIR
ncbi:Acg family FMN-binding oxidoreductase [Streptomyces sp. NPDC020858]|uniref:Acg family FMN-binding oxidoreductase n=1 Tax=Streptomyces sp. NPDC020858 TaxID=3365097 RepID=UPI0037A1A78A